MDLRRFPLKILIKISIVGIKLPEIKFVNDIGEI